jgi:hypothetical protein
MNERSLMRVRGLGGYVEVWDGGSDCGGVHDALIMSGDGRRLGRGRCMIWSRKCGWAMRRNRLSLYVRGAILWALHQRIELMWSGFYLYIQITFQDVEDVPHPIESSEDDARLQKRGIKRGWGTNWMYILPALTTNFLLKYSTQSSLCGLVSEGLNLFFTGPKYIYIFLHLRPPSWTQPWN